MFNRKKKMLAQRKFAQGTVVNQPASNTTSTSTERRAVPESTDSSVHIYRNNTSASRLLDDVAFRHPGMHLDNVTINLTRLPESVFNEGRVIIPSTSRNTVQENPSDHCLEESQCVKMYKHTYFLRSCSKLNNVTKKVVPNTRATSKKRGRPKKSRSTLNCVKRKRLISPVNTTCSEDEQPLSQYRRSKKRITPPYTPRNNDEDCAMLDTSARSNSDLYNTGPFVYRENDEDSTDIGPLVYEDEEEGNNDVNGATIDTSVGDFNIDSTDIGPLVYEDEEEGNNDVNGATIDTSVGDFIIDSEDRKEPIIIPSEGSEDYQDDLFIRESTDDHMDLSDFPNLGSEELSIHDPDVAVVPKEEGCVYRWSECAVLYSVTTSVPPTTLQPPANPPIARGKPRNKKKKRNRKRRQVEADQAASSTPQPRPPTTSNERSHWAVAGPSRSSSAIIEDAPVYYPTEEEFNDPLVFYSKIQVAATKYGICKVVPPKSFEPKCCLNKLIRVSATHQYIGRLFKRWGSGTREMCAIRAQLASHNVVFTRPPLIDGLEVDLPKMFHTVQKYGGFLEVTQKQLWTRVAEDMNYFKILNPGKRLDHMYVKYLLPYDIMKSEDRAILHSKIESVWQKKHNKLLKQAKNPVQLENLILGDSDSSSDEEYTSEEENINEAMFEIPNNDKTTRPILLMNFHKMNYNATRTLFPQNLQGPPVNEAEAFYWSKVSQATDHICVYTASVDTADGGHGFSTENEDVISKHKWNLKNFQHNEANVLKALGPVVSVTSPVLTVGMIFSTHCWHKDPHGLPWVEYHHVGKPKIWYAIPEMRSHKFRKTVEKLCPTVVQNKLLWLPSDLLMIPPDILIQEGVSLTKTIQNPGEYIFVLPNAYTSSICTGITITESVYFAQERWLYDINDVFLKLYKSCEPTMLPQEQLLISLATDHRTTPNVLKIIYSSLLKVLDAEKRDRSLLDSLGIVQEISEPPDDYTRNWNSRDKECDICRAPFFFSKILGRFKNQTVSKMCIKHIQKIRECILSEEWSISLVIYVSDEFINSLIDQFSNKLHI